MKRRAKVRLKTWTKRFGRIMAIRDVGLEVSNREFFVIVGLNGCSKTTVLRLITRLIKPDSETST